MFFKFLSEDYPLEKSFLIISRFCLTWTGEFPQTFSSVRRNVKFGFHCTVLFTAVICQFAYGFFYITEDLQSGLDALCPAITCMVSFIKMVLICWYGKGLALVLKHLQDLFITERNEEKQNIAKSFSVIAINLSFMVFVSGVLCSIFYGVRPLVTNMIRMALGKPYMFGDTSLKVLVPAVTLTLPWYPFTYALIAYMGVTTGLTFSGVGGIYISVCLYSGALFKIMQTDIELTLKQFENNTILSKKENDICCLQLGKLVEHHNEVIEMIEKFHSFFTLIVLLQFVTSSVVIGASIIEAILYPGYRAIVYVTYTLAALCELFIYCYGASEITENSTELGKAAYFSNWYSCDSRVQKMILMIIIRSQKPVTMDVPFFSPNLETFMVIIKTAGSLITLVKSVL